MNTRLKQFIAAENITQSQFADTIKVVRASVSHVLSGRNNPGYDFIKAIMLAYPNLNMEWLLLGKGRMYKNQPAEDSLFHEEEPVVPTPEPFSLPYSEPDIEEEVKFPKQERTFSSIEQPKTVVNQRKVSKVMIFFDDGTYQEMGY